MKRLLTIDGRSALKRYYTRHIWNKKVNDYPTIVYVGITYSGAMVGMFLAYLIL